MPFNTISVTRTRSLRTLAHLNPAVCDILRGPRRKPAERDSQPTFTTRLRNKNPGPYWGFIFVSHVSKSRVFEGHGGDIAWQRRSLELRRHRSRLRAGLGGGLKCVVGHTAATLVGNDRNGTGSAVGRKASRAWARGSKGSKRLLSVPICYRDFGDPAGVLLIVVIHLFSKSRNAWIASHWLVRGHP